MTAKTTIYVYLEDEGTDVWRPVEATRIDDDIYQITKYTVIPDGETWQFAPGSIVRCVSGDISGDKCLMAIEAAKK